jgi:hypothetical protein
MVIFFYVIPLFSPFNESIDLRKQFNDGAIPQIGVGDDPNAYKACSTILQD